MRPIVKDSEPPELTAWKALANEDWQPTSWADLQNPVKAAVLRSLIAEQGAICCYCEDRIADTGGSHIEHLASRHAAPALMFEYRNLLACCNLKRAPGTDPEPPHCGHAKGEQPLPVHPLMTDCREYFEFTSAGEILSRASHPGAQMADETIKLLKLDLPLLEARRKQAIDGVVDLLATASDAELGTLVARLDERDDAGRFLPFCSAVVHVLKQYL